MSRLIDADLLFKTEQEEWLCTNNAPFISISYESVLNEIKNASTVKAVPIEVLREIRAEIEEMADLSAKTNDKALFCGLELALGIIDKHFKEDEDAE